MNRLVILVAFGVGFGCSSHPETQQLPEVVDFNFHVKPILSDRCFTCHGPDEKARKGNLRLDLEETAFALMDTAAQRFAIVPGSVSKSHLIDRIISDDPDYMMPPPESNLSLSSYEVELLKKWIAQGAEWKSHWSFTPPEKSDLPKVSNTDWPQNDIDYFVLDKLNEAKLDPAPAETKEKLLRRLSFDLTGLPPSIEALDAFLSDDTPEAYEKQVDRLLASTGYGERMASLWLEAARYADSHGYQDDRPRTIWPWRDWVIKAFNQNLAYDDFVVWQLAGDLLPNPTYEQKLATAFNRNHAITQEGGVINEEYVTEYVADRTNTVATAFLGMTMECARCHDHKYDPISQKEYYQMFAFFNGIDERGQINYFDEAPVPNMRVQDQELEATIKFLDSLRTAEEEALDQLKRSSVANYQSLIPESYQWQDLQSQLTKGLIAYYKLDTLNNLVTPNEVANGHQAQANVKIISELKTPEQVPGKFNQALRFDGKNYLSLGEIGDFEESDRFSIGAWVKPGKYPRDKAGLLVRRNGEQRRGGYELVLDAQGRLVAGLIHNHSSEKIQVRTYASIPINQWSHVFMTYDGSGSASGIKIFINGQPMRTVVLFDQLNRKSILNGNDFLVGNWTPRRANNKEYFGFQQGAIDEVRVYNRNLTSLEVKAIADHPQKLAPSLITNKSLGGEFFTKYFNQDYIRKQRQLDSIRSIYLEIPQVMIMQEMDTPRATFVLDRGVYDAPTEQVTMGTPEKLLPFSENYPTNRLGLAQWLTDPQHPLTARVAVNRFWQMMFGRGLVNSPEDFGNQGQLPSHPELLDWLAVDFVENQWDVKDLIKQMAMSATYRQSAVITTKKQRIDPENVLLSRGPYHRLEAEMMRDQALAVSGLLHNKVGGKWVKPYQPAGIWKELANQIGENKYRKGTGNDLYRRSLYSYWKRTIPPPFMLTFDASERAVCVLKRQSTSTPLQALGLLNDPQFVEASRVMVQRICATSGEDPRHCIEIAFRKLTSRYPSQQELDNLLGLFKEELGNFNQQPSRAEALISVGEMPLEGNIDTAKLAALTIVTNVIMNLDEAKMKS
jgi:hypothetical protein